MWMAGGRQAHGSGMAGGRDAAIKLPQDQRRGAEGVAGTEQCSHGQCQELESSAGQRTGGDEGGPAVLAALHGLQRPPPGAQVSNQARRRGEGWDR